MSYGAGSSRQSSPATRSLLSQSQTPRFNEFWHSFDGVWISPLEMLSGRASHSETACHSRSFYGTLRRHTLSFPIVAVLGGPMPFAHNVMPMLLLVTGAAATASCSKVPDRPVTGSQQLEESSQQLVWDSTPAMKRTPAEQVYVNEREQMVAVQLASRDIVEQRVLDAMNQVPRHEFVPAAIRHLAYNDSPLPIGHQQTISQPYIVALMTQLVEPQPHMKALDIGTGSGYQAAVLAELVKNVYSIEIVEPLAKEARERLQVLGYKDITIRHGDGYQGWKSEAPFDIIIVAAAPDHVPQPLVDQLAPEGKMVIPVGKHFQNLLVIEKHKDGSVVQKRVAPVAFVPMTGEAQR